MASAGVWGREKTPYRFARLLADPRARGVPPVARAIAQVPYGKGAIPVSDLDDVAQEVFLRLMRYERADLIEHPP